MIEIGRIFGVGVGTFLILLILLARGLPVLFFLKMLPLVILLLIAVAFLWAALTSD